MKNKSNLFISNPPVVFKSISFNYERPSLRGNLIYFREYYADYNHKNGDIIDEKILEALKLEVKYAAFSFNELLITKFCLNRCHIGTRGGCKKQILLKFEIGSGATKKYSFKKFYITFLVNENDARLSMIPNLLTVSMPSNSERLLKTIF